MIAKLLISFLLALATFPTLLKLNGELDWSWRAVLLPIWGPVGLGVVVIVLMLIFQRMSEG